MLVVVLGACATAKAAGTNNVVEGEGLTPQSTWEYEADTHRWIFSHGAVAKFRDEKGEMAILSADVITFSETTGQAVADGTVSLRRGSQLWTSDHLEYNFYTKQIQADAFRTGMPPFYASGAGLTYEQSTQAYVATNAVVTTDNLHRPGFKVRAKRVKIVPGHSIEARDAVLYVGNVPVMYYPYYKRTLERHPNNFVLTPGYRSLYGGYILGKYNWYWSENLSGSLDANYYQKRGIGYGPELRYNAGPVGTGSFQYFNLDDREPGLDPFGNPIRSDRHQLTFTHDVTLRTNLTAKVVVRDLSDPYIMRDFFENEYRKNVQPSSFAEVNQLWPNFSLNLLAQPQINNFFETVERLPDVKLSGVRQQLGVSPFYYESDSSAAYLRYKFANDSHPSYSAFRADSFHQILLPQTFFGWLNVTPRVGGRFTYYSETSGRGVSLDEQERWVFNTGAEVSTKFSRVWTGAHSGLFDVDGLRHILEPFVNYVYVPSPSVLPPALPQFDTELPSYALLPINYPDYNAIDSVDSQNVLRMGMHNKLQTKRHGNIENLVNWDLFTDWRIRPRTDQATFANVYSYMDLKPRSWLTLTSQIRYDPSAERLREADHIITFQPNDTWSWSLGHRYLRDDPSLGPLYADGYNLILSRIFFKLNENWAFAMAHHFEARDGTMEEQSYTIYRDLRSWTAAITFRYLDNRVGPSDFTVALTFSLKAFPRFGMGSDSDTPLLLLGN